MGKIKIIRSKDVEARPLPGAEEGAGTVKRIIYPPDVKTKGIFMGIGEAIPGYSPHRWHSHKHDKAEGYEVIYPDNFEEIYFIIQGTGVMQWKTKDDRIEEREVGPGDTIFMPVGVPEHQLFNNGREKMVLLYCGSPTPQVIFTEKSES
jgi:mannose-6-phosphate isomerase-like protein (cupin superfamily)